MTPHRSDYGVQTERHVMFTAIDAAPVGHEVMSMDADKKMTPAEFDALLPRLGRLSLDTVTVARAVFVDGLRPAEAATKHGTSRQRVNAVLRRIEAAKGEYPADWKRVEVWLPPELAAQVEKMAEDARAAIGA